MFYRTYRNPKENGAFEKRPSLLKAKKEVKQESERAASVSTFDENIEEIDQPNSIIQKRQRKRKLQADSEPRETNQDAKIKIVEDFLRGYGPQLNYTFKLWQINSKVLDEAISIEDNLSENPLKWSVDDVCTFIIKFCDEETAAKFYAQKIDGEALLGLWYNDLIALMEIKMGPATKIYNRIMHLRQEVVTKFIEI